jgi:hypothetical protein
MKIKNSFVFCNNKVASTDFEIFPCGYVSCDLTTEQVEWFYNICDRVDLSTLHYQHQHSIDAGILNGFIRSMGNSSLEELLEEIE